MIEPILALFIAAQPNPFKVEAPRPNPFRVQSSRPNPFVVKVQPAPKPPPKVEPEKPWKALSYVEAYDQSDKDKKPVVAFVGVPARKVEGCHACAGDPETFEIKSGIVVGVWRRGDFVRIDLDAGAKDEDIRGAAGLLPMLPRQAPMQTSSVRFVRSANC